MSTTKRRINFKQLIEMNALPWKSWRTTKRKIDGEGFPAYYESGHYYFDPIEVENWFKRKKTKSAA